MPPFLRILYVFSVIFFGVGMQSMKSAPILRCWKCSDLVFQLAAKFSLLQPSSGSRLRAT